MRRLCIYFFYDSKGIVDRYVDYLLSHLMPHLEKLIVVSNGKLTPTGREVFGKYTDCVIERANEGFDVWAYKTGMESVGWRRLSEFDEIILMNFTLMGPLTSLEAMFSAMDRRKDLHFWGVTKCFDFYSKGAMQTWKCPYGYVPEHVQSSFIVVRKALVMSSEFQEYWDRMPMVKSYYASGGEHEQRFTKYFHDRGHPYGVFTDQSRFRPEVDGCAPLISRAEECASVLASPFFKRRVFFTLINEYSMAAPIAKGLFEYIRNQTDYDVSLILENIIRTYGQRILVETLSLHHVIKG